MLSGHGLAYSMALYPTSAMHAAAVVPECLRRSPVRLILMWAVYLCHILTFPVTYIFNFVNKFHSSQNAQHCALCRHTKMANLDPTMRGKWGAPSGHRPPNLAQRRVEESDRHLLSWTSFDYISTSWFFKLYTTYSAGHGTRKFPFYLAVYPEHCMVALSSFWMYRVN